MQAVLSTVQLLKQDFTSRIQLLGATQWLPQQEAELLHTRNSSATSTRIDMDSHLPAVSGMAQMAIRQQL